MGKDYKSELLDKFNDIVFNKTFFNNFLKTVLDSFSDHVYIKDKDSRFVRVNSSIVKQFNLKNAEEAIGKTDFDFFTKDHAEAAYSDEQNIIKTGKSKNNYIEKETWVDGSVSWVSSTKVPFLDNNGEVVGLFGISTNITDRVEVEIELKKKSRELENRASELRCLIEISEVVKHKDLSAEGCIKKIIELIPKYLRHSSLISSRLIIGNKSICSSSFVNTSVCKTYRIKENNKKIGTLEVFFDDNEVNDGKTIEEETDQVLNLIADRLSEIIEKKWIEKDLRKWEHILKDAKNHIDLYP